MKKFNTDFELRDTDKSRWSRYGLPWSEMERKNLAELFARGWGLEALCEALQRPASGVISKLQAAKLIEYDANGEYYVSETLVWRTSKPKYFNDRYITDTQPQPQPKETTMSNTTDITIVTRTFIGGVDAAQLSDEQIFQLIARKETEIKAWEAINSRPKKLQARIDAAKEEIQKLVDFVDGR